MNKYNLEEEEMTDHELASVGFTAISLIGVVICVGSWLLFSLSW